MSLSSTFRLHFSFLINLTFHPLASRTRRFLVDASEVPFRFVLTLRDNSYGRT